MICSSFSKTKSKTPNTMSAIFNRFLLLFSDSTINSIPYLFKLYTQKEDNLT